MFELGLLRSSHAETLYPSYRPLVASGRVLVLTESLIPNPPRFTPTAPSQSLLPTHLPLSAIAGFFPRASSHLSVELQLSLLNARFEFQT